MHGKTETRQELTEGLAKPPDQRHCVEEIQGRGQKCRWGSTLRRFTQAAPRSWEDSSRIKAAVGFLSLPQPFKTKVNSAELIAENRTLIAPREGNQAPCLWGYRTGAGKQKLSHLGSWAWVQLFHHNSPSIWPNKWHLSLAMETKATQVRLAPAWGTPWGMQSGSFLMGVPGGLLHPQ